MFSKKGNDADGFLDSLMGAMTPDLKILSGLPVKRAIGKVVGPRDGRRGRRRGGGWYTGVVGIPVNYTVCMRLG